MKPIDYVIIFFKTIKHSFVHELKWNHAWRIISRSHRWDKEDKADKARTNK